MSRNIRTFRDIGGDNDGPDSDDSGADVERGPPQEFYAGSGQAVQGPRGPRGGASGAEDHIRRILQAAQAGLPEEDVRGPGQKEKVTLTLHLWTDGLSIEDGPLMPRHDQATIEFLEIVGRGGIPPSLLQQYAGKDIDFNVDRRHEPFQQPKLKPFGGNGVRLGNVVPVVVGGASSSVTPPVATSGPTSAEEEAKRLEDAKKELNTDLAEPTTNIQIRLPNNQRLVGVFNHSHNLEAVRSFICTARPEMIYAPFELMSAYPPKVLIDEEQTLKEANLLNSVIAVKILPAN
ncbi:hypothetical protein GCK72_015402 [Caenorhabditis remanei]|uniref:UBX domain-containing protein n=1 Tax=Caenorhabditis remanei TaxID=31234 RepID=A0A6A5GX64_CAERE|nr:hypothetical protein GCK72_015402 [Caenorhabditis remanei]KAF1758942.1 hypothetical protein GCK72_015402 [Caenorhabditis remanei]